MPESNWCRRPLFITLLYVFSLLTLLSVLYLLHSGRSKLSNTIELSVEPQRFTGKVVLVTGGTSGIGLATAKMFADHGVSAVIVCGRTTQKWLQAQKHLTPSQKLKITFYTCDVRIEQQVSELIQHIFTQYGRLDIAHNNAGIVANSAPIQSQTLTNQTTPSSISYSINTTPHATCTPSEQSPISNTCENSLFTDALGVFNCMKWEIFYMRQYASRYHPKDPPCIVNTASVNALWGSPGGVLYGAAKGLCLLLTRGTAVEQASVMASQQAQKPQTTIRINCVAPGPVNTPLLDSQIGKHPSMKQINQAAGTGVPMGRVAEPEEIASTVLFLADNKQASYITGACLVVDGGLTAAPLL